jgi:hypothetical protein
MLALGLVTGAQAGPAMFQASFVMHAFGNDTTTGTSFPYNTLVFVALPLGHNCQDPSSYTPSSVYLASNYCYATTLQAGQPATGSGTLSVGTGSPASIMLPQSAFGITTVGARPLRSSYLQSDTYATFVNASGTFFSGGGPGSVSRYYGCGETPYVLCPLVIQNGEHKFGGAMPLLGRLGGIVKYVASGVSGTYAGTSSWNMIKALGRKAYVGDPLNPYTNTGMFYNAVASRTVTYSKYGRGTLWTTGMVAVYAEEGYFTTILHGSGHDTVTSGGVRNLQLVTPALTHWVGSGGAQYHTGHIGILTLQVPEPGHAMLLAAGVGRARGAASRESEGGRLTP